MSKYLVFKKHKPTEARIFKNKKLADAFVSRVKKAKGAKLVRRKIN